MAFNCYFSYATVSSPDTYAEIFGLLVILKNILYGLGNIYSNVNYVLYDIDNSEGYKYYYSLAYEIGNSFIRIFYKPPAELNS